MAQTTTFITQILHAAEEPLDKTLQVDTLADLDDFTKSAPYVGKLVHVKSEHKIYICYEVSEQTGIGLWRPMFNDQGTEWYITSSGDGTRDGSGQLYTITAEREANGGPAHLEVTYPVFLTSAFRAHPNQSRATTSFHQPAA